MKMRAVLFGLSLLLLPLQARAEFYAAAASGIGWTKWRAPARDVPFPIELSNLRETDARLWRWEAAVGWRVKPWLAIEGAFGSGTSSHTSTSFGLQTAIRFAPGVQDRNSVSITDSFLTRRSDVLALGPVVTWPLGRSLRLSARAQVAQITDARQTLYRSYSGFVFEQPNLAFVGSSTTTERFRTWRLRPGLGLEWTPPRFRRLSLGLDANYMSTQLERVTVLLARASLGF